LLAVGSDHYPINEEFISEIGAGFYRGDGCEPGSFAGSVEDSARRSLFSKRVLFFDGLCAAIFEPIAALLGHAHAVGSIRISEL
jgi:hypothetical protein